MKKVIHMQDFPEFDDRKFKVNFTVSLYIDGDEADEGEVQLISADELVYDKRYADTPYGIKFLSPDDPEWKLVKDYLTDNAPAYIQKYLKQNKTNYKYE
jgi:hypothetical protein